MPLFAPETWPFTTDLLPAGSCLVGGSVRDRLLQRRTHYLDLDFVLPERAIETARAIANRYQAGFVVLDQARHIARVVFENTTVDFAQQEGNSLEADLRRRDFTVNAIAYDPAQHTLIDPLGGEADLTAKTLRMVSYANLEADPLRLLRGYRQAAQLGFELAPDTEAAIAQLAPKLKTVSIERVRSELDALLSIPTGTQQLKAIAQNHLLTFCLPALTTENINQVAAIDQAIAQLQTTLPAYGQTLQGWRKPVPPGCYRSWVKAAKLSRLISPKEKAAKQELAALTYSNQESQTILTLLKVQPDLDALQRSALTRAQQFFLFKTAGETFHAVALLALSQGTSLSKLQPLINQFQDPTSPIAHAEPLVTGNALMQHLKLKPGPILGKLINAVEQAQARGDINSEQTAIAWAKQAIKQL